MHRDERVGTVTAWLLAGALFLSLAWPIAIGRTFVSDDLGGFHLPIRQFFARCLASGDDYRWFPGLFCGFYVHGESQAGLAHPLHWLLYRTLPLGSAMQAEIVLGYPAMFLGMAVWLRRLGLRRDAAGLGAIVFAFSNFLLLRYVHVNAIEVIAHLPWLLLGIEVLALPRTATGAAWAGAGIAVLTASQILMGYPQYVGFSLILEGGYALLRFGKAYRIWLRWMIAKALGLSASAAQLLPLVEALRGSVRANPSRDFLGNNSLHPWNLAQIVAPLAFRQGYYVGDAVAAWPRHEYVAYLGAIVPASCAWLWIRRADLGRWRPLVAWALGLAAIAIVLSLGKNLPRPLFPIYARLPLAKLFRAPSRYFVVAQMASAVLAAVAFSDLASLVARGERLPRRRLRPLLVPVAASLAVGAILMFLCSASPSRLRVEQIGTARDMVGSVAILAAPTLLFGLGARGWRYAPIALIVLAAADSATFAVRPILRHERAVDPDRPGVLGAEPPPTTRDRVVSIKNDSLIDGARLVEGYVGLPPRRQLDYTRAPALRVAGAAWERSERTGERWEALPAPLPRVRLVAHAVASQAPKDDLDGIDPATTVLTETAIATSEGPPGEANLEEDRPGFVRIRAVAPSRRVLVLSESFHPGWRVEIDARPGGVIRSYGDFLGCVIDPGPHEVVFRFDPTSDRLGRWLSAIGLVAIACLLGLELVRARSSAPAATGARDSSGP